MSEQPKSGRYEIKLVTPMMAQELINTSKGNRSISDATVERYERDMRAGRWPLGDGHIGIHKDGWIANGHHRLIAVVQADMSVYMRFLYGLTDEDVAVIDQVRARKVADYLAFAQEKNVNILASTVRHLVIFAMEDMGITVSSGETEQILQGRPRIRDSVALCAGVKGMGKPSALAAIHYLGSVVQNMPDEANDFVEVFRTGVPAYHNDPAHLVREKIIHARGSRVQLQTKFKLQLLLHAWALFAEHRSVRLLRPPEDGFQVPMEWTLDALFEPEVRIVKAEAAE